MVMYTVAQHPAQTALVLGRHANPARGRRCGRTSCGRAVSCAFRNLALSIGVVVSETTSETRMAAESVTANSRKSRPTMPPISRMGINTAISEVLIESTVKPISREPSMAASKGAKPVFQMAADVLDHHDGVVDHKAGGDGQGHQAERLSSV